MFLLRAIAWKAVKRLIHKQFSDVQSLSTKELAGWLAQPSTHPPLLIDARAPAEYQVSHLPNAHLAPSNLKDLHAWTNVTASTPIVVYCSVGYRSAKLAQRLQAEGYQTVFNLEGSIFQWANEDRPLYQQADSVNQVHPFNRLWGLLLASKHRLPMDASV